VKTIQIPGSKGELLRTDCVNWGDKNVYLKFSESGVFTPDKSGDKFNPALPTVQAKAGDRLGPFVAPGQNTVVNWTFDSSDTGNTTPGRIEVKDDPNCIDK
jgi:hypothetical protein